MYPEGSCLIAQCLEYDITAQAETLSQLRASFERLFVAHVGLAAKFGETPFENVPRAPQRFFRMWEQATTFGKAFPIHARPQQGTTTAVSTPTELELAVA